MPKFYACIRSRIRNSLLSVFHWRNKKISTDNRKLYGKTQILTRRFHMRLHASNFGIQFLSRNIKGIRHTRQIAKEKNIIARFPTSP